MALISTTEAKKCRKVLIDKYGDLGVQGFAEKYGFKKYDRTRQNYQNLCTELKESNKDPEIFEKSVKVSDKDVQDEPIVDKLPKSQGLKRYREKHIQCIINEAKINPNAEPEALNNKCRLKLRQEKEESLSEEQIKKKELNENLRIALKQCSSDQAISGNPELMEMKSDIKEAKRKFLTAVKGKCQGYQNLIK